jgi:Phage gp6-like head-tail connector protein
MGYTDLPALKNRLGIVDTQDDVQLNLAIDTASAAINRYTGRFFGQVTGVQAHRNSDIQMVHVPDLVSVSSIDVDTTGDGTFDTHWPSSWYRLEPFNALTEHGDEPWPYTRIRALAFGGGGGIWPVYTFPLSNPDRVRVTAVWGWPAVPTLIGACCLQLSVDTFKAKDMGPSGDSEGAAFLGATKVSSSPVLRDMLSRYVRGDTAVGV